ncbi:putative 3-hydroxyisobutyrate dehydrogenase mitochondrial [Bienertia sinuspersici]
MNVGFIGLGNMGSRMAMNLLKSGYRVCVHDMNGAAVKQFLDKGVPSKETPKEVAEVSDVVITMLPSSKHVMDVYMGQNGLLHSHNSLRPHLFIDSSTIDPLVSRKLSLSISDCTLKEKIGGSSHDWELGVPANLLNVESIFASNSLARIWLACPLGSFTFLPFIATSQNNFNS